MSLAGIVLAAGQSSRMGCNKLLLPIEEKPMVCHVVEHACAGGIKPLVVVLGRDAQEVQAAIQAQRLGTEISFVENRHYHLGQGSSLCTGLCAIPQSCTGAMFLLGDQPFVSGDTLARLKGVFLEDPERWVAPEYKGRRGNPVLAPQAWFARIKTIQGDTGPRAFLEDSRVKLVRVPVTDAGVVFDVDTPEEYSSLST